MTRIFDALRKSSTARHAAPRRDHGFPLVGSIPLADDVVREMTSLRVTLDATLADRSPRIVMFLSSQGGEGNTTVALRFAQTLARDPKLRTLYVDAHARRPALEFDPAHRVVTVDRRLLGRANADASMAHANLSAIPVSEELRRIGVFSPVAARELIDRAGPSFDWIVFDGPPVLESPEAAQLASVSDGVLVVVQSGRTKRPVLSRSVDLLRKAGVRVLGSVLNRRRLEIPEFIYRRI